MHSDVRVVKEAGRQLSKALSWLDPLAHVEWVDEERLDQLVNDIKSFVQELADDLKDYRG